MSTYSTLDGIVSQYRMFYPYRVVKDLDMPETIKIGAMVVGDMDIRYPGHGMSAVKTILEHSRPEYLWSQTPTDEISSAVSQVRSKLFDDATFKEQVLSAYESQAKPSIDRFRAYERKLRELEFYTDPFMSSMSDWKNVAKIYKEYRQLDEMDRLYLLGDMPLEFVPMIDVLNNMEKRYGDLIQQDLKDVPKAVYESLGIKGDVLESDEYGFVFPYLYMVKHLQTLSEQSYFGNQN
jgi:hypothetical protein